MARYCLVIVLWFAAPSLYAQEENTGFYLLRTGNVLEGSATFDGRHYVVQTPFGTMHVPAQSVEFVGKSKTDVYQHKRIGVDSADYNALVRLAEWCISNGFLEEGIAEYQRAGQVAPNAVFAGIVQQRLETLQQTVAADTVQNLPIPHTVVPADTPAEIAVSQQLFESFVRRVQPMLVNRCIAADCHGTHSEQRFKLGIPHENMGRTSRRNLQAVLPYIDRDYPMESPLLSALTTPHGGTRAALNVESNLYVQIVQWVQQIALELPEQQFRPTVPQAEHREQSRTIHQECLNPLDPAIFNARYHP